MLNGFLLTNRQSPDMLAIVKIASNVWITDPSGYKRAALIKYAILFISSISILNSLSSQVLPTPSLGVARETYLRNIPA